MGEKEEDGATPGREGARRGKAGGGDREGEEEEEEKKKRGVINPLTS